MEQDSTPYFDNDNRNSRKANTFMIKSNDFELPQCSKSYEDHHIFAPVESSDLHCRIGMKVQNDIHSISREAWEKAAFIYKYSCVLAF